jgi:hypothetical protein
MLDDVETFEVNPHGVRGIGQTSVGEGIGSEQVAEFVMGRWLRDAEYGNQGGPNKKGQKPDRKDRECFSSRQPGE